MRVSLLWGSKHVVFFEQSLFALGTDDSVRRMRICIAGIRRAGVNFLSTTSAQFYASEWMGSFAMSILKISAAMAALLFMSVSAQAMEFADRPGSVSEALTPARTIGAIASGERLRRQIDDQSILQPVSVEWMKLADRPRPISNLKGVWVVQRTFQNRLGRLSAEFSAVTGATNFDHHTGPIGNLFPPLAADDIAPADHNSTSSLTKTIVPAEIKKGPAESCVGSMAPCGSMNFAETTAILLFLAR
jgi:hypothetical protein